MISIIDGIRFNMGIISHRVSRTGIHAKASHGAILDVVELFAVLISIPASYYLSMFLLKHVDFFFYNADFKFFIYRYFNYFNYSWKFNPVQFIFFSALILISWYVLSQLTSMAMMPGKRRYLPTIIHFVRGNIFILFILFVSKYLFFLTSIPVVFILTYVAVSFTITLTIRLITIYKLGISRACGFNLRNTLVIADEDYMGIIDSLINQKEWGYRVSAISTESEKVAGKYCNSIPLIKEIGKIKDALENRVIDEVLYCKKENDIDEIQRLVKFCDEIGVIFRIQSCISPTEPVQIDLRTISNNGKLSLVELPSFNLPVELKTITDIYMSVIAAILLSPVFLLITLLIKIDSRGPVFFKQERVGLRGRKFMLYKFRTMVADAESQLEKLRAANEMDGPTFKMKDDPRITRIGRFLRKTGLDEFPQLINVIRGEMSLIGPRPPLESEVRLYERWQLRRLSVKPGITCTWQIMPQRNDIKFEKWMRMDLNYIDNWSLLMDIRLIFMTIRTLFVAGGR